MAAVKVATARTISARWNRTILVCAKCSKKVDGGFGKKDRKPLAKALRAFLNLGKGRKAPVGVVEVKCLGLCPKGLVTLVDAAQPGQWRLVAPGTPVADIAAALRLDQA